MKRIARNFVLSFVAFGLSISAVAAEDNVPPPGLRRPVQRQESRRLGRPAGQGKSQGPDEVDRR